MLVEVLDVRRDGHRVLGPLDADGVRESAGSTPGEDVADAPIESIARSSRGVPGRVHEAMSEWARDEATRRLEAAAEWLIAGRERRAFRSGLREQRDRTEARSDLSGTGSERRETTCPYKGLAAYGEADARFFFGREGVVGRARRAHGRGRAPRR